MKSWRRLADWSPTRIRLSFPEASRISDGRQMPRFDSVLLMVLTI